MEKKTAKHLLLLLFFILLWAPIVQDSFHLFKGGGLKGAYTSPSDISFDFKKWFDGSYPEKKTEYLSFNFGFRPDFVRMYNQLKFWLFKSSGNENIVIGKENYLYEQQYISEYFGTNYVGEKEINTKISQLKELQDTLKKRGVFLFTVFAPGKGSCYPEYIPDNAIQPKKRHTNYTSYIAASKKAGINFIDMKAWFLAMKDTSRYRLFPRYGVHWSEYGDFLAFDSLVRYVENETGKDLPDIKLDGIQLAVKPRGRDYDAGDGLNIITENYNDTLAYPFFSVKWKGKDEVSSLTIGDSYYFNMYGHMGAAVFKEVDFWYYFSEFWSINGNTSRREDIKELLCKRNVVCLMYTDATLGGFGSDFLKVAHEQFQVKKGDSIAVKSK